MAGFGIDRYICLAHWKQLEAYEGQQRTIELDRVFCRSYFSCTLFSTPLQCIDHEVSNTTSSMGCATQYIVLSSSSRTHNEGQTPTTEYIRSISGKFRFVLHIVLLYKFDKAIIFLQLSVCQVCVKFNSIQFNSIQFFIHTI